MSVLLRVTVEVIGDTKLVKKLAALDDTHRAAAIAQAFTEHAKDVSSGDVYLVRANDVDLLVESIEEMVYLDESAKKVK